MMTTNLAMIGGTEIILVSVVVLVLFGAAAIPKFARSLGTAKSEFEKGLNESSEEKKTEEKKEES